MSPYKGNETLNPLLWLGFRDFRGCVRIPTLFLKGGEDTGLLKTHTNRLECQVGLMDNQIQKD